jgi:adenosylcobinamide-GDP ribazoletransferase
MKKLFKTFYMSFGMFCAIPVPTSEWDDSCANRILVFFPIIGLIIGLLWYGLSLLLGLFTLPIIIKAALIMLFPFVVTGFLHLDGFMDSSDALLSRRSREEKLRILKDPHTGAFAVISLGVVFVLWFASVHAITQKAQNIQIMQMLIFIPVLSRAAAGFALLTMKTLEQSSYAAFFKKGTGLSQKIALAVIALITCGFMIYLAGIKGAAVCGVMLLLFWAAAFNAKYELGGVSGDVAGYALTIAETAAVLIMAVII